MGRSRTLLGTEQIAVRIPVTLIEALDEWAEEDGVSRNTLVSRELATAVNRRKKPS
jgi:predicted HicB family RNase H-like nuclease